MATILVADGEQRSALAVVRSLGSAGHEVHVCSHKRSCIAAASRHARSSALVPHPLEHPAAYVQAISDLVRARKPQLVLPNTEASLLALLSERESISARIPWPALSVFQAICDKSKVAEVSRTLGIEVPRQRRLDAFSGLEEMDIRFPVVVKPGRSVVQVNGRREKLSVTYVAHADALASTLRDMPAQAFPVLIQERVDGDGVGVFVLMHEGELIAAFSHRRLREKPPAGGVSVLRESIPLDRELLERSLALLRQFNWNGPAMVEYKVDRSGVPHIMEINGRFWGSLQLAIDAGVDFPALLVDTSLGKKTAPVTSYRLGVKSRWFLGDLDHLILRLRKRREALALPNSAPSRLRAALDFVSGFAPRNKSEVLRVSDPLPAVRETLNWFRFED